MFRTNPNFYQLLDKATSNLHLEPDWPTILQLCDLIRQGDIQPKIALAAIKKKIVHSNPHIALYGLLVLESCVKNCGSLVHNEIGTKQYMEQIKELVKSLTNEEVKTKTLGLIQAWAFAFRNSPKYTAIKDTVNIMKAEGYVFPELKESDAMFSADTAPAWADGDVCHRCRVVFGMVQRKHHCRACGQVFCGQCSNKTSTLPKYGIEKEVRVCDACYASLNKPTTTTTTKDTDLPVEYLSSSLAQQQQVPQRKSDEELREEEELQLALALSQSEAEQKEKEKKRATNSYKIDYNSPNARSTYSSPPSPGPSPSKTHEEETDPELAKYLNRKYWEQRQVNSEEHGGSTRVDVTSPSAPNISSPMPQRIVVGKQQNGELIDSQLDEFVADLSSQVEIFVNRMKSNSSRGRSIINDSFFQGLFMNITEKHSKLLKYIQKHDDTRVYYEGLQDKLTVVKEARAALDALREEHRERLRREAHEAERQKQIQMAMKLDIMRKKKQEYLNYQRQLALQKIQERERELHMRQEHQKQQYMMGGYQPMPTYMGPAPQGSPIRHVHYQTPGPNYNTMSPTNQAVYNYDQTHMGQYPMNYGMPSMQSHMMPANPSEQQPPPGPNDSMIQQRESMGPNMMAQMPGVPQMTQIPGPGNNPPSIAAHPQGVPVQMAPRMGQPPPEVPQNAPGSAPLPNTSQIPSTQPQLRATGPPPPPPPPSQGPPNVQLPQSMPHHVSNNIPGPGPIQITNKSPQMTMQYQQPQPVHQPAIQQPQPVHQPAIQQPQPVHQPQPIQQTPPQAVQQEIKKTEDTAELISFD